ncbi:MAG: ring-opening amidohydrolase [Pseudomonadota bacterium]
MPRRAYLHSLPADGPDDVSGFEALVNEGVLDPMTVRAVLGKTEGNGCVNDFTRGLATRAWHDALARHLGEGAADVCLVMSGGTEGALSPHWLVFGVEETDGEPEPGALALGTAHTEETRAEALGTPAQAEQVARAVRAAIGDAGISGPEHVHFVQVKCPLLTSARIAETQARGRETVTTDTLVSMGLSRGASALGVALALGEIDAIPDGAIGREMNLYSSRASASAGIELLGHEVLVLGRSDAWAGPMRISHAVMTDAVDLDGVSDAKAALDIGGAMRLRAVLAKAEASRSGTVRGARHTMLTDSDLSSTRHARAFVGGALGGLFGTTTLFVSGGAEHQGPDGGGPVAVIAERQ